MHKDYVHAALKWTSYNRYKCMALVLFLSVLIYVSACVPQTYSVLEPSKKISPAQFEQELLSINSTFAENKIAIDALVAGYNAEVDAHNAKVAFSNDVLEAEYARQEKLFSIGTELVDGIVKGSLNSTNILVSLAAIGSTLGGIGAIADSKRKDKVIAENKIAKI